MTSPPAGFVPVPAGHARLWVRAGLEGAAPALLAAWAGEAAQWIEGGRAPHPVVTLPDGGSAVVRRYLRGGAIRHLNHDRYFGGDRAADELRAAEAALRSGVRTPEVVAAGRRPARLGYRAMIATRLIPGARHAAEALAEPSARGGLLRALGAQLARMHGGGIAHPDVNLRNVLVDAEAEVWLIDFDRARVFGAAVSAARRESDISRLARSAAKLGVPFSTDDLAALREGYGPGFPIRN
jgi:3-deoxy-D-manno-octulosonic acid kinase